eukprot:737588-Alexandrium_andersonii.AAC.1
MSRHPPAEPQTHVIHTQPDTHFISGLEVSHLWPGAGDLHNHRAPCRSPSCRCPLRYAFPDSSA